MAGADVGSSDAKDNYEPVGSANNIVAIDIQMVNNSSITTALSQLHPFKKSFVVRDIKTFKPCQ